MTFTLGQKHTESKVNHTDHSNDKLPGHLLIDSGASQTLIRSAHHIHSASPNIDISAIDAQKKEMPIKATVNLQTNFGDNTKTSITVLNTPNVAYDLLGLSELAKQNITACFTKNTLE